MLDEQISGFAAKLRGEVPEEEEEEEPAVVEEAAPEEETSIKEESIGEEEQKGDHNVVLCESTNLSFDCCF